MSNFTVNTMAQQNDLYPIVFHTASDHHIQETVRNRILPSHQILLVLDGKGTLLFRGVEYPIQKGCGFFTAKDTLTEYVNEGGLISAFLTAGGPAADLLCQALSNDGFLFLEDVNLQKYLSMLQQLIRDYHDGCDQGKLSAQAYSFFVEFLSQKKTDLPAWLEKTVTYINLHFDRKLTLSDLAQQGCISVSKLCHDFKRHYGVSVFEYIMSVRLQYAHNLLLKSPETRTKDAAIQSGFFDVGYFCKMYRKQYGKSPSEQRRGG